MGAAIFSIAYSAVALLCVAMRSNHGLVFRDLPTRSKCFSLRITGVGLLAVAYGVAARGSGWSIGTVEWTAAVCLGGLLATALVAFRPRWTIYLAAVALLGGALSLGWHD